MNMEEKSSNKCADIFCERSTHKESKYCIFHTKSEEKEEKEFKKALKEYIKIIKENNLDCNFARFIFKGKIDFKEYFEASTFKNIDFQYATFNGIVDFRGVTFEEDVNFFGVTFGEDTDFRGVIFKKNVDFQGTIFKKNVDFQGAIFEKNVDFEDTIFNMYAVFHDAIFEGGVKFDEAIFKKDVNFRGATFKDANFYVVTFEERADFYNATFKEGIGFDSAIFKKDVDFLGATFKKDVCFDDVTFAPGITLVINIKNSNILSFVHTFLENVYLVLILEKNVFIDFKETMLKNTKIGMGEISGHILQEQDKKYFEAKEIYLLLKNNFHSIGRYEDESWAFKKEKEMERKSLSFTYYKKVFREESKKEKLPFLKWIKTGDFNKWIISGFSNIIYGYGEKPWNVIFSAGILIFIFALLFNLIGIGNPEIIELKATAIHQTSGNIVDLASKGLLKNNVIRNFPDSLYFSLITFTTLGYGDFRPLEGWGRILAGSEAFIGAFMMALFVYTFARRTGGR